MINTAFTQEQSNSATALYAVVNVESKDVLNIRSRPGISYDILGTIPSHGINIQIDATSVPFGELWVPKRYQKITQEMVNNSQSASQKRIAAYEPWITIPDNNESIKAKEWLPIRYKNISGWVNSHYLARQFGLLEEEAVNVAQKTVWAIKEKNYEQLADVVHPEKGICFSLETVFTESELIFSADHIRRFMPQFGDRAIYKWSPPFDFETDPDFTFEQYLKEIYDANFVQPHAIGFNTVLKGGTNAVDNMSEFFPKASFVYFHFCGFDKSHGGMDWSGLRLALKQFEGKWYVVGIGHGHWSI